MRTENGYQSLNVLRKIDARSPNQSRARKASVPIAIDIGVRGALAVVQDATFETQCTETLIFLGGANLFYGRRCGFRGCGRISI